MKISQTKKMVTSIVIKTKILKNKLTKNGRNQFSDDESDNENVSESSLQPVAKQSTSLVPTILTNTIKFSYKPFDL